MKLNTITIILLSTVVVGLVIYNEILVRDYNTLLDKYNAGIQYYTAPESLLFLKYLNNTNNYSSCWDGNSTVRQTDCYNCENFTLDYINNIKTDYKVKYVAGIKPNMSFGHAFAKIELYVDPTNHRIMSKKEVEEYRIYMEETIK